MNGTISQRKTSSSSNWKLKWASPTSSRSVKKKTRRNS